MLCSTYWTALVGIFIFIFIHLALRMPIHSCMASFIFLLSMNTIKVAILHPIENDFIIFIFH